MEGKRMTWTVYDEMVQREIDQRKDWNRALVKHLRLCSQSAAREINTRVELNNQRIALLQA
jgi:hypothetical protein